MNTNGQGTTPTVFSHPARHSSARSKVMADIRHVRICEFSVFAAQQLHPRQRISPDRTDFLIVAGWTDGTVRSVDYFVVPGDVPEVGSEITQPRPVTGGTGFPSLVSPVTATIR
jgi:hypothetical protein